MRQSTTLLCDFTQASYNQIIYDSDRDGWDDKSWKAFVLGRQKLAFINITEDNHIFGGYASVVLKRMDRYIYDEDSFIFSFNVAHGQKPHAFRPVNQQYATIYPHTGSYRYYFGNPKSTHYFVISNHTTADCRLSSPHLMFKKATNDRLADKKDGERFTLARLLVVSMN